MISTSLDKKSVNSVLTIIIVVETSINKTLLIVDTHTHKHTETYKRKGISRREIVKRKVLYELRT